MSSILSPAGDSPRPAARPIRVRMPALALLALIAFCAPARAGHESTLRLHVIAPSGEATGRSETVVWIDVPPELRTRIRDVQYYIRDDGKGPREWAYQRVRPPAGPDSRFTYALIWRRSPRVVAHVVVRTPEDQRARGPFSVSELEACEAPAPLHADR
jgi:hypothetical protein